jgi:uncharacterized protein YbaP (TraB family)
MSTQTQYAYEFGKRWNVKTPRRDIAYRIGAMHVGTAVAEIEAVIQEALDKAGPEFTPAIKRQCLAYARIVHDRNLAMYRRVMGGR